MLDFPTSPVVGQVLSLDTTNMRWTWDGDAWRRVAASFSGGVIEVVQGYNATAVAFNVFNQAV